MGALWQDIRYGIRMLVRSPRFTIVGVLILALGIGASTAMFSVVNTFILNPVPLPGGDRLFEINEIDQAHNQIERVSPLLYEQLEEHREVFEVMASFNYNILTVSADEFIEQVLGCKATPSFFEIFSVKPTLGRVFRKEEGSPGDDDGIIISDSFWRSRFGGRADIVGQRLETSEKTCTIIGVMPRHFQFPSSNTLFWRPVQLKTGERNRLGANWWALGRLKVGVSRGQAQAFLDTLNARLATDWPGGRENWITRARPLRDFFVDPSLQRTLWALMGAIGFVLLIACANLANLHLARTESRLREVTVRMALGAGRRRVVRQLITESLLLSLPGGLGGVLIAAWGVRIFSLLVPRFAPLVRPMATDQAMLLCALVLSIATGVACGLLPAWYASRIHLSESLKESASITSPSSRQRFFRSALVVTEVALAFVLLVGAALMIQSVARVLSVDPGYDPTNLAQVDVTTRYGRASPQNSEGMGQLLAVAERLAASPGTTAVGLLHDPGWQDCRVEGREEPVRPRVAQVGVGRYDLFRAIRVPLREGRLLQPADNPEGEISVVVNESLARLCWPGESAVGKRMRFWSAGADVNATVVGIVGDYKQWGYDAAIEPTVYMPFERNHSASASLLVRTSLDPASLMQAVRRDMKEVLPDTYAPSIDWLEQVLWASTYSRRLYMQFICAFGAAGLLLSALGIFGVLAYSVSRRTREIGIRMALGARKGQVTGLIMGQGMRLVFAGLGLGLLGTLALTRTLQNQLFGVQPIDPVSIVAGGCLLVAVSLLACYLPGRHATKIDPVVALRYE